MELATGEGFGVSAVYCREDRPGWSAGEERTGYGVVLVRRGRFRRRWRGAEVGADPALGYVSVPGDEERFAHPHGGDVCTSITVSEELWHATAGEGPLTAERGVYVDARLELAHRRCLAAVGDVRFALAEELLELLAGTVRRLTDRPVPAAAPPGDRALVTAAREAVAAEHPAAEGLFPLAALLGVSPYRLSRAFPRELGVSLTRYRNRARVGRALDRLAAGETDLAALAADLGFADQAHLTRTVRAHLGHTPATLRSLASKGALLPL
ncbi:AraC-like DNA-binding protein [Prauserella shujinwangii]|uniref:AraC-like DNA-binding protein n=1 Tax=Prauserella shujinwangii TaxID=1453103 RepID=A0A2T0LM99_9PSEU|nr:AraC-like DNA-binding protein [Prauserella shujinwangii]